LRDIVLSEDDIIRFWSKVNTKAGDEACWTWKDAPNEGGYGTMSVAGTKILAHRIAWTLTNGPVPAKLLVLHRCNNPPCVNPAHLFVGTHADNAMDMEEKGRQKAVGRVLNEKMVRSIRRDFVDGLSYEKLAAKYPVGKVAIRNIIGYKTWPNVGKSMKKAVERRKLANELKREY
jgi:hypothetical protein